MNKDNNKNEMDHKISPHPYKGNKGYNFFYVVESRYASYQRYVSVTKGQAFKGRCYHIIIVPPNGIKKPCGFGRQCFSKATVVRS